MKIFDLVSPLCFVASADSLSLRSQSRGQEVIEPYNNHFLEAPALDLKSVKIPEVSPNDWMNFEQSLVQSAYSRYIDSDSIKSSTDFLESQFRELGLDVSLDRFPTPGGDGKRVTSNVIGRLTGSTSESVLMGAHYDDLPIEGEAPGADDNASGVATLLSVARALAGFKPKRNIIFVAFSGEEQGMIGSGHFVYSAAPNMDITSAIIMDQNGNPGKSRGVILESVGKSQRDFHIIDTIADSMDGSLTRPVVNYNGFGSDHVPLANAGIPSVLVIERENMKFAKTYGHTSRDDLSNIDPVFGSGIANTVLRAVVRLAME